MKAIIIISLLFFACSSEDPAPQASCEALISEIASLDKSIADHQSRGSQGNQSAWEAEMKRLIQVRGQKQNEANKRICQ